MFERNDRSLPIFKVVMYVGLCIALLVLFILGIISAVNARNATPFFICMGTGCVTAVVFWAIIEVICSFFLDVKFIRNKLYDVTNEKLEQLQARSFTMGKSVDAEQQLDKTVMEIERLRQLLSADIITEDEFEVRKQQLIKGE